MNQTSAGPRQCKPSGHISSKPQQHQVPHRLQGPHEVTLCSPRAFPRPIRRNQHPRRSSPPTSSIPTQVLQKSMGKQSPLPFPTLSPQAPRCKPGTPRAFPRTHPKKPPRNQTPKAGHPTQSGTPSPRAKPPTRPRPRPPTQPPASLDRDSIKTSHPIPSPLQEQNPSPLPIPTPSANPYHHPSPTQPSKSTSQDNSEQSMAHPSPTKPSTTPLR